MGGVAVSIPFYSSCHRSTLHASKPPPLFFFFFYTYKCNTCYKSLTYTILFPMTPYCDAPLVFFESQRKWTLPSYLCVLARMTRLPFKLNDFCNNSINQQRWSESPMLTFTTCWDKHKIFLKLRSVNNPLHHKLDLSTPTEQTILKRWSRISNSEIMLITSYTENLSCQGRP